MSTDAQTAVTTQTQVTNIVQTVPSGTDDRLLAKSSGRWWAGVSVGCLVSVPFGWLLSFAGALPFFLGLFFFVLIGLLIGAFAYRAASPGRPYASVYLILGTSLIVAVGWSVSIIKESRDLPQDVAEKASRSTRDLKGLSLSEFQNRVASDVRTFINTNYPPGGTVGYVRWFLTSGEIRADQIDLLNRNYVRPMNKAWFGARLVLSVAMLAFGVGSQTLTLRKAVEPSNFAINDEEN